MRVALHVIQVGNFTPPDLRKIQPPLTAINPSLSPILPHVVCYDGWARDWAASKGYNPALGLALLVTALTDLAVYYRFVAPK
jgi:hypothetical protein